MADAALLAYLQELMTSYDSTIATTSGSTFRTTVIDPLLKRFGDSPLDGDLETFLVDRLKEEHPTLDTTQYSGIRDLVIRPMATMLAPLSREITAVKNSQSLNNYSLMSRAELDALMGNFFLSIKDGSKATGSVRMYFSSAQAVVVTSLTEFTTSGGLVFYPTSVAALTTAQMSFNQDGTLFYMDVGVVAAETGSSYNVAAGAINGVNGVSGAVKVSNLSAITAGTADETMAEAVARAKASITTRTLATSRGISTVLLDNFTTFSDLQVIGFGETEMIRDVATGISSISGVPGGFDTARISTSATSVHIGGKTDVYVEQSERLSTSVNITNVTDVGTRVLYGSTGYTLPGSSDTTYFDDEHGYFTSNGVKVGDYIRIGSEKDSGTGAYIILSRKIGGVSGSRLTLAGSVPAGMSNKTYEVVSYEDETESLRNHIYVPLYDLVAETADSAVVTNTDGNPVYPVPGDPSATALKDAEGNYIEKDDNVAATGNILLPLFRVKTIDRLDPTSLEIVTGQSFPRADVLYAEALADFTYDGSEVPEASVEGTIRVFFADPVSAFAMTFGVWADGVVHKTDDPGYDCFGTYSTHPSSRITASTTNTSKRAFGDHIGNMPVTTFLNGSNRFVAKPVRRTAGAPHPPPFFWAFDRGDATHWNDLVLPVSYGDVTEVVTEGMWVSFNRDITPRQIASVAHDSGTGRTTITTRAIPGETNGTHPMTVADICTGTYGFGTEGGQSGGITYSGDHGSAVIFPGTSYSSMSQDSDTGLYYMDIPVVRDTAGEVSIPKGTKFTTSNMYAEGWTMNSKWEGYAFSAREKPYLRLTNWVRDQYLRYESTAYAIRLNYEHTNEVSSAQVLIDSDDYRIVSEDVLIKSFIPRLVSGSISVTGITASAGLAAATNYINSIGPNTNLEVSDLVSALYDAGATYVALPISLTVRSFDQLRGLTAEVVQNTADSDRIKHFLTDSITVTVVS